MPIRTRQNHSNSKGMIKVTGGDYRDSNSKRMIKVTGGDYLCQPEPPKNNGKWYKALWEAVKQPLKQLLWIGSGIFVAAALQSAGSRAGSDLYDYFKGDPPNGA
jgi:hypothetical protein